MGGFDHHCPWLNTCIGEYNYGLFFQTVVLLLISESIIICSGLLLAVGAGIGDFGINIFGSDSPKLVFLSQPTTYVILLVFGILRVPLWMADLALLLFHIFLCYKGVTTFEYMRPGKRRTGDQDSQGDTAGDQTGDSSIRQEMREYWFGSQQVQEEGWARFRQDAKQRRNVQREVEIGSITLSGNVAPASQSRINPSTQHETYDGNQSLHR